jgi:hypothetical protein
MHFRVYGIVVTFLMIALCAGDTWSSGYYFTGQNEGADARSDVIPLGSGEQIVGPIARTMVVLQPPTFIGPETSKGRKHHFAVLPEIKPPAIKGTFVYRGKTIAYDFQPAAVVGSLHGATRISPSFGQDVKMRHYYTVVGVIRGSAEAGYRIEDVSYILGKAWSQGFGGSPWGKVPASPAELDLDHWTLRQRKATLQQGAYVAPKRVLKGSPREMAPSKAVRVSFPSKSGTYSYSGTSIPYSIAKRAATIGVGFPLKRRSEPMGRTPIVFTGYKLNAAPIAIHRSVPVPASEQPVKSVQLKADLVGDLYVSKKPGPDGKKQYAIQDVHYRFYLDVVKNGDPAVKEKADSKTVDKKDAAKKAT